MGANSSLHGCELSLVKDGERLYVEVRYQQLTTRVRVRRKFDKTYEAVKNCLSYLMKREVGDELRPHLERLLGKSGDAVMEAGTTVSEQERVLARELRRLGVPFRQQVQIAGYVADFLVGERIVVEVEGTQHYRNPEREVQRLKKIEEQGYEVHRVSSYDVMIKPATIAKYVKEVYVRKKACGGI